MTTAPTTFIQEVFSKTNTNILISQDISIESQVRMIIEDIHSDRHTRIELDNFYNSFDLYQDLQQKKQELQTQIATLTMNDPEYTPLGTEIKNLTDEEKKMRVNILELALTFEKAGETEKLQQSKIAYLNGELQQIDHLLTDKYLENEQRIQQVTERLVDNANEFLVKAQVTNLRYELPDRFEKAIFYFDKGLLSAKASQDNFFITEYLFDHALFLQNHNQDSDAISLYEESLNVCQRLKKMNPKNHNYSERLARIHSNLGIVQSNINQFNLAEKHYQEALVLFQELSKKDDEYLHYVGLNLNNLGTFYNEINDLEKSINYHQKALKIRRDLAEKNSAYVGNLALNLNNLGHTYSRLEEIEKGEEYYGEAIDIYRNLIKTNNTFRHYLASVLLNLGDLKNEIGDNATAKEVYEEALNIKHELSKENPQAHLPDLALIHNSLALVFAETNEFEKAEKSYIEAIEIYKNLSKGNRRTHLMHLAGTLYNLANLQTDMSSFLVAEESHLKALKIREELVQINSNAHEIYLADSHFSMSNFYKNYIINQELSVNHAINAIKIYSKYQTPHTVRWQKAAQNNIDYWQQNNNS